MCDLPKRCSHTCFAQECRSVTKTSSSLVTKFSSLTCVKVSTPPRIFFSFCYETKVRKAGGKRAQYCMLLSTTCIARTRLACYAVSLYQLVDRQRKGQERYKEKRARRRVKELWQQLHKSSKSNKQMSHLLFLIRILTDGQVGAEGKQLCWCPSC